MPFIAVTTSALRFKGACAHEGPDPLLDVWIWRSRTARTALNGCGQITRARRLGAVLLGHPCGYQVVAAAHERLEPVLSRIRSLPQGQAGPSLQA